YTDNVEATKKVGVIAGVGDRRDEDTVEIGSISAQMFDEIIIRQDKNLRGRTEEELIGLLKQGIEKADPSKKLTVIPSEEEAILYAVNNAQKGSLVVLCSDVVPDALEQIKRFKAQESNGAKEFK